MERPKISIVIPCYNHGNYILEAIKSVEEYKAGDYEIIIINDGSTDDFTNQKLNELKESGYNVIFQNNQGLAKSRNIGIKIAKGEYILPLDADNKIKPELLFEAIKILDEDPRISIVYSYRQEFGNSNKLIKVGRFDLAKMLKSNYIDACAVYRKEVWKEIGGYDEKMPLMGLEDWDFWLCAAEKGYKFYNIKKPLFYYRVIDNSMLHLLRFNPKLNDVIVYIYMKHIHLLIKEYNHIAKYIPLINGVFEHKMASPIRLFYRIFLAKKLN